MKKLATIFFLIFSNINSFSYAEEPISIIPDQDGNMQINPQNIFEQNEAFLQELPTQDYQATFIKMFVVLIALIALIAITIWMIKKLMHNRQEVANRSNQIQILEKRILSPKSILYLVEVEGQKILISESQFEVRPLHSIAEDADDLSDLDPDFLLAESSKL